MNMKTLNTKKRIKGLAFSICTLASFSLMAQGNWEDNSGAPSNVKTTTQDDVGIGTATPEAHEEILYCPDNERGLIITKVECGSNIAGGGTGGEVNPPSGITGLPVSIAYPSYLFNFSSPIVTGSYFPITGVTGTGEPLLWVRTRSLADLISPAMNNSRFIVLPNGKAGINVTNPRAALDVMSNYGPMATNKPLAIFGIRALNSTPVQVNGVDQDRTKHIAIYNNLTATAYNPIVKDGDMGMLYTDGMEADGSNNSTGLVIAPWSTNPNASGIRLDALGGMEFKANNILVNGNAEIRGTMKCNGFTSEPKWWPDFVFEKDYELMSLDKVAEFINKNHHLPNMPSRETILSEGQNIGEIQQLQQQKIEELTLYTIELKRQLDEQKKLLGEMVKRLSGLEDSQDEK